MRSVADRLLETFVPHASARAAECAYEYRCVHGTSGSTRQRRWCCYNANGSKSCGGWANYQTGC